MAIFMYTSMKCIHVAYHPHLTCALRVEVIAWGKGDRHAIVALFGLAVLKEWLNQQIYGCPAACIPVVETLSQFSKKKKKKG